MKKVILAIYLFFILPFPVSSQETILFLPLILKMGNIEQEVWKVISPVGSTNYVLNPSAETTSNFSAAGSATVSRSTTKQLYGVYGYSVATGRNADGINLTLSTLTNAPHTVSFRVNGRLPNNLKCILGSSLKQPLFIEKINPDWSLYACTFSKESSNGQTNLRIIQQGNGIGNFYLDGIQVEPLEYWTTYIDGDQKGCSWNGSKHGSSSTRSAKSYDGGQVIDLYESYNFFVTDNNGAGMIPRQNNVDDYAILPGGEINSVKINVRDFSLVGKFVAGSEAELRASKKALYQLLAVRQELLWRVYLPTEIREIKAIYNGGLEGSAPVYYDEKWSVEDNDKWVNHVEFVEPTVINLKATDPYFYGVGDRVAVLDTNDSATFRTIAGRLKNTGQWSALGPPNAAGTYTRVRAIVEDATYVYIGGNFLNFDNIANADYIVRYNKQTGIYSAMGTGANNEVFSIVIMPNGDIIAGGLFTSMGGVANTRGVARWNGSTWIALGSGANNDVYSLSVTQTGKIVAGGVFSTIGGVAVGRIAQWDGGVWSPIGTATGADDAVQVVYVMPNGDIVIGGDFTSVDSVSASRIARWNGSTWIPLSSGANASVRALASLGDDLIAGGFFSTMGGINANRIAQWNGTAWNTLGSGLISVGTGVFSTQIGSDGILFASGSFTSAGGVSLADRIARWNGYTWVHLDIDLPGSAVSYGILASKFVDPIIKQKYDLFLGFDTTGTGYFAGKITTTNNGNVPAFPKIIFERSGGTAIIVETLRNEDTGKELLFNYGLLDGERLTVDLTPQNKSVISNYFGSVPGAILANSDFDLTLDPGNNTITSFVANPNIAIYPSEVTAWLQWREAYESFD